MIQTAIGRRYAKALFELLTPADIGPAKAALRMLAEAFVTSNELRNLLVSPIFAREQKASVIEKLAARAGCPTMGQRFLAHVVSKNRIAQIREISEAFSDLTDRSSNRTAVEVSSARPLSEEDCRAITMKPGIRANIVIKSSLIASVRNLYSRSSEKQMKGSTTMEGLSVIDSDFTGATEDAFALI